LSTPLAEVYREIKEQARAEIELATDRAALEASLVDQFLQRLIEAGLVEAAARQWLAKVVHDTVGDLIKPAGASPRAAAGQMLVWAEMQPVAGWRALRTYARQMRGVYLRYQLVVRILACLDIAFGEDIGALDQYSTLADACLAAGVDVRDVEALAA